MPSQHATENFLGCIPSDVVAKYENLRHGLKGDFSTVINFLVSRPEKVNLDEFPEVAGKKVGWTVYASSADMENSLNILDGLMDHYGEKSRADTLAFLLYACGISFDGNSVLFSTSNIAASILNEDQSEDSNDSDLSVDIGDRSFQVHSSVMANVSPFFAQHSEDKMTSINISYVIEAEAFQMALDYIYTGKITLNEKNIAMVRDCIEFLGISDLKCTLQTYDDIHTMKTLSGATVNLESIEMKLPPQAKRAKINTPRIVLTSTTSSKRRRTSVNYKKLASGNVSSDEEYHAAFVPPIRKRAVKTEVVVHVEDGGSLQCDDCGEGFNNLLGLLKHKTVCGKDYKAADSYEEPEQDDKSDTEKSPKRKTTKKKAYPCESCSKSFKNLLSWRVHTQSCGNVKSKIKPYMCKFCSEKFSDGSKHRAHVRKCRRESAKKANMPRCEKCGERFNAFIMLRAHELRCGKVDILSPKKSRGLKCDSEKETPKNERECFNCEICGNKFKIFLAFKMHQQTCKPVDDKPEDEADSQHPCSKCGSKFKSLLLMKSHEHSCAEKAPLAVVPIAQNSEPSNKCDNCNTTFKNLLLLKAHERTCERVEVMSSFTFNCDICHQHFTTRDALNHHLITHETFSREEESEEEEDEFKKQAREAMMMIKRQKTKLQTMVQLQCPECEKICTSKRGLQLHLVKHRVCPTEKKFRCPTCRIRFSLKHKLEDHRRLEHGAPDFRDYQCIYCGRQFGGFKGYSSHMLKQHNKDAQVLLKEYQNAPVPCAKCGFECENMDDLRNHIEMHKDDYFQCHICNEQYKGKGAFNRHMCDAHNDRAVKIKEKKTCEYCNMTVSKRAFKVHYFTHVSKPTDVPDGWPYFACDECPRLFPMQYLLDEHKDRWHSTVKAYMCEVCAKPFGCARDVKRHLQACHLGASYKCDLCDKTFTSKTGLKIHKFTHTDIYPYHCKQCDQRFRTKGSYTYHERVHMFEKTCEICDRTLRPSQYERHMQLHERSGGVYDCDVCKEMFASKDNMERHKKSVHGNRRFPCKYCDKEYATQKLRRNHEKLHTGIGAYKCEVCSKLFPNPSGLKSHFKIHTGQKDYNCSVCLKAFASMANKNSHERSCILKQKGIEVKVSYNPEFIEQIQNQTIDPELVSLQIEEITEPEHASDEIAQSEHVVEEVAQSEHVLEEITEPEQVHEPEEETVTDMQITEEVPQQVLQDEEIQTTEHDLEILLQQDGDEEHHEIEQHEIVQHEIEQQEDGTVTLDGIHIETTMVGNEEEV